MARSRHLVVSWFLIVIVVVAVAVAVSLTLVVLNRGHDPSSSPSPRVAGCGYKTTDAQVQPLSITLTCADGGMVLDNVQWRSWKRDTATGVGALEDNDCNPDCADGTTTGYPVDVTVQSPEVLGAATYFRSLRLTFLGPIPQGLHSGEVFKLPLP